MRTQEKIQLSIDDLKIESFVTSLDKELSAKLMGGLGIASEESDPDHPTHTILTLDHEHVCFDVQC
jgi:hypothetical protein